MSTTSASSPTSASTPVNGSSRSRVSRPGGCTGQTATGPNRPNQGRYADADPPACGRQ